MDTRFSEQDLAFREEVRAFFSTEYTQELQDRMKVKATFKAAVVLSGKKSYMRKVGSRPVGRLNTAVPAGLQPSAIFLIQSALLLVFGILFRSA